MKNIVCILLIFSFSIPSVVSQKNKRIIGYIMGSKLKTLSHEIDVKRLTHLNYAFADVVDGEVVEISKSVAEHFVYLNKLKAKNTDLKILISVGGWTRSGGFSDAVLTEAAREKFANSAIAFMTRYQLDGIDLDWEYPGMSGDGNKHRPEDKENFTAVLALLREKLDTKGDYLLTIASAASPRYLDHVEMDKIHHSLDFINIMAYDYFGAWSAETGNHAQLFPNGDNAVRNHLSYGVPSEKLVLGAAFYGRGWKNVAGYHEKTSQEPFYIDYHEIKEEQGKYNSYWDSLASAPYLYSESTKSLIGFDSPLSMRLKAEYVKANNLGGIMFWEYSGDDNGDLLNTIYSGLNAISGHAHNDYENDEPLMKALNLGMKSIEVDVHLIDDELYVSHNRPYNKSKSKTLEQLYLEPLTQSDFIQYPLYVLIDIKTAAEPTYSKLREVLQHYQSDHIIYVISGNRAMDLIANDSLQLMTLDGRPDDVNKTFSSQQMPIISQNYKHFFSSRDTSKIDLQEKERFNTFVKLAHKKHILVRLWATPDNEEMWRFLEDQGVDLINTDDPEALNRYLRAEGK